MKALGNLSPRQLFYVDADHVSCVGVGLLQPKDKLTVRTFPHAVKQEGAWFVQHGNGVEYPAETLVKVFTY